MNLHIHTLISVIQLFISDINLVRFSVSTDQKADKASFYNFSKLKKNRKWLKVCWYSLFPHLNVYITHNRWRLFYSFSVSTSFFHTVYIYMFICFLSKHSSFSYLQQNILLTDDTTDSDTDSDDSDFCLSREELHDMLRLHRFTRQHQSKFHSDREVKAQMNQHKTKKQLNYTWLDIFWVLSL